MKKHTIVRTFVALGAAIALLPLAACSPAGNDGEPPADDGTLRVLIYSSNEAHLAVLNEIADEFVAANDEIAKVEFQSVPYADTQTVLTTQLSAGDPPDVSWLWEGASKDFIEADALFDLAPTMESTPAYNLDDLVPEAQELWRRGDQQFGVPFSTSTMGMYFNADVYRAAGLPTPEEMIEAGDWTWESFRDASATIAATQGIPGYVVDGWDFRRWDRIAPLWTAYGASPWDESGETCTMDSSEMADAMSLLTAMIFDDKSVPQPGQAADFWSGGAGATNAFVSSAGLLSEADFEWGFVPTPSGPAGDGLTLYQSAFVAYKDANYPEAAAEFIATATNPENSKKLSAFFPPARASLLTPESLAEAFSALTPEQLDSVVIAGAVKANYVPTHGNSGTVNRTLDEAMNANLFIAGADVEEGLTSICDELNPVLSQ